MKVICCIACEAWIGHEQELSHGDQFDICPKCESQFGFKELSHSYCPNNDSFIVELWKLFGDIPIDDCDRITEDFLGYPVGTDRFEIWLWFDEKYKGGVHALIERGATMSKYEIYCKGSIEVEACDEDEAVKIALDNLHTMTVTDLNVIKPDDQ